MKFAVFFRNLNLGRPPAPSRIQFEQSFLTAGANSANSFLTNGTLVFETRSRQQAAKILNGARAELLKECGFTEPGFLRELGDLKTLTETNPFAAVDRASVYECCITFFDPAIKFGAAPPIANSKKSVEVIKYTQSEMLSVCYKLGASPGSPNAFAEREFKQAATTRAWNTVCRLVEKFDQKM